MLDFRAVGVGEDLIIGTTKASLGVFPLKVCPVESL
jgi:hypothetical protein